MFAPVINEPQRDHIRGLVMQLISAYSSPQVSIDQNHTPNIYARFLSRLLTRADELDGAAAPIAEQPRAHSPNPPELDMDELFVIPPLNELVS